MFFFSSTVSLFTCHGVFYLLINIAISLVQGSSRRKCKPYRHQGTPLYVHMQDQQAGFPLLPVARLMPLKVELGICPPTALLP